MDNYTGRVHHTYTERGSSSQCSCGKVKSRSNITRPGIASQALSHYLIKSNGQSACRNIKTFTGTRLNCVCTIAWPHTVHGNQMSKINTNKLFGLNMCSKLIQTQILINGRLVFFLTENFTECLINIKLLRLGSCRMQQSKKIEYIHKLDMKLIGQSITDRNMLQSLLVD